MSCHSTSIAWPNTKMLVRIVCVLGCVALVSAWGYGSSSSSGSSSGSSGSGSSSSNNDQTTLTNVCEDATQTYKSKCECTCDCPAEEDICPPTCASHGCEDGSCGKCVVCDWAHNETECNVVGHAVECCPEQEMCLSQYMPSASGGARFRRTCASRDECPIPEADHRWNNWEGTNDWDPRTMYKWCQLATCNPWGCAAYVNSNPWKPHCSDDIDQKPMIFVPYQASPFTQGNCRCDSWCWVGGEGGGYCDCCPDYWDYNCNTPRYGSAYSYCTAETTSIRGRDERKLTPDEIVTL